MMRFQVRSELMLQDSRAPESHREHDNPQGKLKRPC